MKAAVYHAPYNIIGEEVEKPQPGSLEILVKVKACGICGTDLHTYRLGLFAEEITKAIPQGRIPGHEFAGVVVEIGPGVEGIEVGDRVMALAAGAMVEYVVVTPAVLNFTVYRLPPEVSYEEAATLEPLATSLHCARLGAPANGEQVVVFGAGIIGLGIIQCVKALGVDLKKLIVADVADNRLAVAKKLGATDIINVRTTDFVGKVTEIVGTVPLMLIPTKTTPNVDLVYDAVGYIKDNPAPPALEQALNVTHEWGRVVVVGVYEGPMMMDPTAMVAKQIKVQGSYVYNIPDEVLEGLELIRARKVDRNALISHTFPLEKAKEAFETQANAGASVKVIFKT
jgi:threonine dehydrogenase-like Zn-dependent dehydrogenase